MEQTENIESRLNAKPDVNDEGEQNRTVRDWFTEGWSDDLFRLIIPTICRMVENGATRDDVIQAAETIAIAAFKASCALSPTVK